MKRKRSTFQPRKKGLAHCPYYGWRHLPPARPFRFVAEWFGA